MLFVVVVVVWCSSLFVMVVCRRWSLCGVRCLSCCCCVLVVVCWLFVDVVIWCIRCVLFVGVNDCRLFVVCWCCLMLLRVCCYCCWLLLLLIVCCWLLFRVVVCCLFLS